MAQRRSRQKPSVERPTRHYGDETGSSAMPQRNSHSRQWRDLRETNEDLVPCADLTTLIEQDAPLRSHTVLVLMYGPFQAEMHADQGLGVASWLRECVRKHGIPSLMRFDYRHRVQVFRRDQFQLWLEPLMPKIPG